MSRVILNMYTVYRGVSDRVGPYTVRHWSVTKAGAKVPRMAFDYKTLEEARAAIPEGMVMIKRSPEDDPVIVETWI